MKTKFALSIAALMGLVSNGAMAQELHVLTSIKPIQMITEEIMLGAGSPDVLLQSNASPHDYALKPSDVKKINQADLVIWFGEGLEPFLGGVLEEKESAFELADVPNVSLREYSHEGHDHDHDGHNHGLYDPHFWLGYQPTLKMAKAISDKLISLDAEHADLYQANYQKFAQTYADKHQQLKALLEPVKQNGYFVFHDAYGYFEQDYQLNNLGHFTVSPERKPGAKTLIKIRNQLRSNDAKCVFSEPQYTPAVIETVMRGSEAKKGVLDPVASTIDVKPGSYFEFIDQIANSFVVCLSE